MTKEELKALFDKQAAGYDQQWAKMSPIRDALHFLLNPILGNLPSDARILCVGAGTGAEIAHLARKFPRWTFTAVDPSSAMLELCRQRAEVEGYSSRCRYHGGYVDSLPEMELHQGATCFLVSQFILDPAARTTFFRDIASRLTPGGLLISSDLACDTSASDYDSLLPHWLGLMSSAGVSPEMQERARAAYGRDVAVVLPETVASIIESAGFNRPVNFYQAGLLHAWFCNRLA